ncbi:CPBP family glutamic-type intramembrane protease [Sphingomonas sp. LR61]|uniref:CPBP family glutamic-type intramembrane protease n=1 Tax=Sphingomonas sp. LR61 TaxID=3050234 RepID=UPI003FA7ECC3
MVACVTIGTPFGWLRLRSGSLWPSVFAHGALNASAGLVVLFSAAGHELNPYPCRTTRSGHAARCSRYRRRARCVPSVRSLPARLGYGPIRGGEGAVALR